MGTTIICTTFIRTGIQGTQCVFQCICRNGTGENLLRLQLLIDFSNAIRFKWITIAKTNMHTFFSHFSHDTNCQVRLYRIKPVGSIGIILSCTSIQKQKIIYVVFYYAVQVTVVDTNTSMYALRTLFVCARTKKSLEYTINHVWQKDVRGW